MANGERDRPFRRHASAAAVAMGPGIPFTMTRISSEDAIGREVVNAYLASEAEYDGSGCDEFHEHRGAAIPNKILMHNQANAQQTENSSNTWQLKLAIQNTTLKQENTKYQNTLVGPNPTNLVVGIVARKTKRMSFQCAHR
eukprot:scaffold3961_cov219-Chaetoceros_neogracile.AAC.5